MSKKQMTKTQSQRWHTKWAIKDRYGIFCNSKVYFAILDLIKSGQSEMMVKQSNTRALHKVYLPVESCDNPQTKIKVPTDNGNVKLYVVYDRSRGELVTVLPWYENDDDLLADYEANHKYSRD
ncbi:MAG: hypothetical protein WC449_04690 [Candidatus Paceibacterota bacterium]